MTRRRNALVTGGVSLFPFLTVLICTMGSLIVLLVVVVQQSRDTDKATVPDTAAADRQETATTAAGELTKEEQLQDLKWQIEALTAARETTLRRLKDAQLNLSMTEDQTRQLSEQLDRLEREAQQLEAVRDRQSDARTGEQQQLETVRTSIAALESELAAARARIATQGPKYAILPYLGSAGTTQRPIYIECRDDRVILQPEGIELVASDFPESMGPGNPLATALRAVREHWLNTRVIETSAAAYPLLIVRPNGAHAYAACRQAMAGWDDNFGYELVPDAMQLEYPPADPTLTRVVSQAIRESRLRANLPDPSNQKVARFRSSSSDAATQNTESESTSGDVEQGNGGSRFGNTFSQQQADNSPTHSGGRSQVNETASTGSGTSPRSDREGPAANSPGRPSPGSPNVDEGNPSQTPNVAFGGGGSAPSLQPLATSRGKNWALPNSADGSIGMTRPVTLQCEVDRLILPPPGGEQGQPQEFPFRDSIAAAIPPFVDALWKRIDSWGTAGFGAYWKPTLLVEVRPGGEAHFDAFCRLMEDSGFQIERR